MQYYHIVAQQTERRNSIYVLCCSCRLCNLTQGQRTKLCLCVNIYGGIESASVRFGNKHSYFYCAPLPFQLKVGFFLSDELVLKVNDLTAGQEETGGVMLVTSDDGDRQLVFKQDLKVLFSNNTSQVITLIILYTLTSMYIFSLLISKHFLRCWRGEFG